MPAPRLISMHIITLVKFPRTNFSVARLVWTIRLKNPATGNWVPFEAVTTKRGNLDKIYLKIYHLAINPDLIKVSGFLMLVDKQR